MSRKRRNVASVFKSHDPKSVSPDRRENLRGAVRASVENLERRLFLTATITPTNIAHSTDTESISVEYTSLAPIDPSTFGNNDISVTDSKGKTLNVTFVSSGPESTDVTAVYTVAPPAPVQNGWTAAEDGTYNVTLPLTSVADTLGIPVGPANATFQVAVADTTPPTAAITAPSDITTASSNPVTATVIYNDDVNVSGLSLGDANLTVTGPAGNLPTSLVSANPSSGNAQQITATYSIAAPSGGWANADNGQYTIALGSNPVQDTAGNNAVGTSVSFNVAVPFVDTTAPTASISAPSISSAGGTTQTVTVTYADDVLVKQSTITKSDLTVTGPSGPLTVQSVNVPDGNAASITVTYIVTAPGGNAWSSADNGNYTISLAAGSVTDTAGNGVAAGSQNFNVAIPVPDTTPPTAVISAPSITSAVGTTETVTVVYTDDTAVKASTIAKSDLTVTGPSGPLTVQSVNAPGNDAASITATYTITAPGGKAWSAADDGNYAISLAGGSVTDTAGNGVAATSQNFSVGIQAPDTTPPTAVISAPSITSAGGTTETVTVVYTDDTAVKASTIAKSDLTVTGPSGPLTVQSVNAPGNDAASITATYTIIAPGGKAWSATDDGNYSISLAGGSVTDTAGNGVAATSQNFSVGIQAPDTTPPTAVISAPSITSAGGTTETVTVVYTDDTAVKASTIAKSDLTVTGPTGPLTVQSVNAPNNNAASITATYTITAPGGRAWSAADDGNYSISIAAGSVTDTSGNGLAAGSQNFAVNIPVPDTTPPTAVISAPSITSAGGTTEDVTVSYTDNVAVKQSSISKSDITITGPGGPLTVQSVTTSPGGDAASITATYVVAAPGGKAWSSSDDGNYAISLAAGTVTDTSGNGVGAGSQNFSVNIAAPDTAPPTASISAANVTGPGGSNEIVTVTYSDSGSGVDASTIDSGSVTVTGANGPLSLVTLSKLPSVDGPTVSAVYTFAAPDGAWSPTANGNYTVSVVPGHVTDVAGNGIAATTANFNVNAGILDTTPPIASIAATDITSPGGTSETVVVTYTDSGTGVDPKTIGKGDITVSGPGGNLTVISVHTTTTAGGIVATYTVGSPDGQPWSAADNGGYTVTVVAGSVKDLAGNGIATSSGGFSVNATVPDTSPPVASISAPNITAASTDPQVITVTYADPNSNVSASTLGTANISVSGPQGPLDVTDFSATPSGDAPTLTVIYTVAAPLGGWSNTNNGTYTVAVNANQVKDPSGNSAAVATATFTVNVAAPGDPSDTSFNGGQPVTAPFVAEAVVTLPDGQLMLAGHEGDSSSGTSQGVLELLNPDGSVDTSFGTGGMVTTPTGENFAYYALVIQGNNHVIVAGGNGSDFLLQRFDFNGNLDATFGSSGTVLSSFGGNNDTAYSLALTSSGEIVAGGASNGNFAFARYDANGNLDPTFAQGGLQLFEVGSSTGAVGAIALQSNGYLVAAGSAGAGVAVVRLDTNGEADPSFGDGGLVMVNGLSVNQDLGETDHVVGLAIQGSDILVAKHTSDGHFGLVRLLSNGSVDTSFGVGGMATADFGGTDDADAIIQENTGQILVLGTSLQNDNPMTAVAAFDANGNPLADFGSGGKATFAAAASSTTRELHIGNLVTQAFGTKQSNGQVVVGTSGQSNAAPSTTALRRIIVPGSVGAQPAESFLGAFGTINNKNVKLTFTTPDNTTVSLVLKGATGNAFLDGDQVRLSITQVGTTNKSLSNGTTLTVTTRGGSKSVNFANITVNGALKTFTARTANLFGTLYGSQMIKSATLGNVESGAAIVSDGPITSLKLASLTSAQIISGASLDSTGVIDSSTTYGPGKIQTVTISGAAAGSLIAAGVDPIDGNFLDSSDTVFGGVASLIQSFSAHGGIDSATHLVSGKIGTVHGPKLIKQPDPRIIVLLA